MSTADTAIAEAQAAQAREDWDTALTLWADVRAQHPDRPDGWLEAVHCLGKAGRPLDMEVLYGEASERFPHLERPAIEFAWMAHHRRDWTAATERWQRLHRLFPGHLSGYLGGAFTLSAAGDAAGADALLERAMAASPDNPEFFVVHARQAHHRGDLAAALPRWAAVRERFPANPRGYIEGAACLRDAGDLPGAEAVIARAIEQFPNDINLAMEFPRLAERRDDHAAAAERWAAFRGRFADRDLGYIEGARALLRLDRTEDADTLLTTAMGTWPDNAAIAGAWADLAVRRNDWAEAVRRWETVRGLLPHAPEGYVFGSQALARVGRDADAERLLDEGRLNNPGNLGLATSWAELAARRQEWPTAADRWCAVRQAFPHEMRVQLETARCLAECGRVAETDAVLDDALARFPGALDVWFTWAHLAPRSKPFEEVLSRWARFRELFPGHHAGYVFAAWMMMEQGRTEAAEALASEGVRLLPGSLEIRRVWGDLASRRGDIAAAAERFGDAVRRHPEDRDVTVRYIRALTALARIDDAWAALTEARRRWPKDRALIEQAVDLAEGAGRSDDVFALWQTLAADPEADAGLVLDLAWRLFQAGRSTEQTTATLRVLVAEADPGTPDWLPVIARLAQMRPSQSAQIDLARAFLRDEPKNAFTAATLAVMRRALGETPSDSALADILPRFVRTGRIALTAFLFSATQWAHDPARAGVIGAAFARSVDANDATRVDPVERLSLLTFGAVFNHAVFRQLVPPAIGAPPADLTTPEAVVSSIAHHARAAAGVPGRERLKIAVCVSGQLRGYQKAFQSWSRLGLDHHDVTYFVDTWRDIGRNWRRIWAFATRFPELTDNLGGPDAVAFLRQRYPTLAEAVLAADVDVARLQAFYGTPHVAVEDDKDGRFVGRANVWKMHYKIERAHRMARESGIAFDLILRIRPDIAITREAPVDWSAVHARAHAERLLFTDLPLRYVHDKLELGDQFAVGAPDVMDIYAAVLNDLTAWQTAGKIPYGLPRTLRNHEALGLLTLYRGILAEQLPVLRNSSFFDPSMPTVSEIHAMLKTDLSNREIDALDRMFIEACSTAEAEKV